LVRRGRAPVRRTFVVLRVRLEKLLDGLPAMLGDDFDALEKNLRMTRGDRLGLAHQLAVEFALLVVGAAS